MTICLNCGKNSSSILCDECVNTADIRALCEKILNYDTESCSDITFDKLVSELIDPKNLRFSVIGLSEFLEPPEKNYYRMLAIKGNYRLFPKSTRKWLYENSAEMLESDILSDAQKQAVNGNLINCYLYDYEYENAEAAADKLCSYTDLEADEVLMLGDYYIKTRRYEKADKLLNALLSECEDENLKEKIQSSLEESHGRRLGKANGGHAEYLPAAYENRIKYKNFLEILGIDVYLPVKKEIPRPIEKGAYPEFADVRNAGFRSFVAYDVETTGLSTKYDSIIEIGAVRVTDGVITQRFQKFVKPFKRNISVDITMRTGITPEMVKDADEMWTVFNEFADFAGDDILVGYNNRIFDNKFLIRAGRYANRIINNSSFDVMHFALDMSGSLGLGGKRISLGALAEKLEIENPHAHRALADAETTAKVYLKLLDMEDHSKCQKLDDILDDEWM